MTVTDHLRQHLIEEAHAKRNADMHVLARCAAQHVYREGWYYQTAADYPDGPNLGDPVKLEHSEWSPQFEATLRLRIRCCRWMTEERLMTFLDLMKKRVVMGAFRYGLLADRAVQHERHYDRLQSAAERLRLLWPFEQALPDSVEPLLDVANMAMLTWDEVSSEHVPTFAARWFGAEFNHNRVYHFRCTYNTLVGQVRDLRRAPSPDRYGLERMASYAALLYTGLHHLHQVPLHAADGGIHMPIHRV